MNYLLIMPGEMTSPGSACLCGARAARAIETHDLRPGIEVAAVLRGGRRGKSFVQEISTECVKLSLDLTQAPLPGLPIEVIAAVPRPQTVRKLLQLSATFGIRALHFLRTHNVVKSYLSSVRLQFESIEEDLILGMEQSGVSHSPAVEIHPRFKPFIEDVLPPLIAGSDRPVCLLADTRAGSSETLGAQADRISSAGTVLAAIGPESGWTEREAGLLKELGFLPVSLGDRMLRVETAFTVLIAQLQLLKTGDEQSSIALPRAGDRPRIVF